ncbi:MAG: hypothetical protein CEN89_90 [Candidatus Berkelbacteria bacterium Licking1014_7]|uniref:Uncharacterized protein n=1 Tax=Candidatus Berkelbacteria bacterium Licking1014_7 TaxID=2017147 RepID=A0A554LKK5_9BACT|nr:MAG: hypothetical protein CEN89_90 [Candidatus Berkelbacteria bacterium Licking1014_7]
MDENENQKGGTLTMENKWIDRIGQYSYLEIKEMYDQAKAELAERQEVA